MRLSAWAPVLRPGVGRNLADPGARYLPHRSRRAERVSAPDPKRNGQSSANIRSLTSQGHAYAVFRRALDQGSAAAALAAAADLPHVGLVDALELCLLLRDDGARFERAIVRWQARYASETAGITVEETLAVLPLLAALRGPRGPSAAYALAALLDRRGLERAGEVLVRWAASRDSGSS